MTASLAGGVRDGPIRPTGFAGRCADIWVVHPGFWNRALLSFPLSRRRIFAAAGLRLSGLGSNRQIARGLKFYDENGTIWVIAVSNFLVRGGRCEMLPQTSQALLTFDMLFNLVCIAIFAIWYYGPMENGAQGKAQSLFEGAMNVEKFRHLVGMGAFAAYCLLLFLLLQSVFANDNISLFLGKLLNIGMDIKQLPTPYFIALIFITILPRAPALKVILEFPRKSLRSGNALSRQAKRLMEEMKNHADSYEMPEDQKPGVRRWLISKGKGNDADRLLMESAFDPTVKSLLRMVSLFKALETKGKSNGIFYSKNSWKFVRLETCLTTYLNLVDIVREKSQELGRPWACATCESELLDDVYDLVARFLLATQRNFEACCWELKRWGFVDVDPTRFKTPWGAIVGWAGGMYVIMFVAFELLFNRKFATALPLSLSVGTIIAASIFSAYWPKACQAAWLSGRDGKRPAAGYVASAVSALMAFYLVNVLRDVLVYEGLAWGDLAETLRLNTPFVLWPVATAAGVAFLCDNPGEADGGGTWPDWLRRAYSVWLRPCEGLALAALLVAVTWFVLKGHADLAASTDWSSFANTPLENFAAMRQKALKDWAEDPKRVYLLQAFIGVVIGYIAPAAYRQYRSASSETAQMSVPVQPDKRVA